MKPVFLPRILALLTFSVSPLISAEGRMNVLFIPVDDLKPLLGCYGNETILTPNMDRLAERGTVFLNNACQQAVCGPWRASILRGVYPDQTGIWDLQTKMRDVNPDVMTLPQYFKEQGYATTGLGKTFDPRCVDNNKDVDAPSWSIPYGSVPLARSREYFQDYIHPETIVAARQAEQELAGREFDPPWFRNRAIAEIGGPLARPATECVDAPDDAYWDGAIANAAIEMLDRLAGNGEPFFLSVGFFKPHLPFAAPKSYWDLYDREKLELATFQERSKDGPAIAYTPLGELGQYSDMPREGTVTEADQKRLIHGYMATVSFVDAQIGKVLDHLDKLGLADNTIICLWGDHGWHLGDHGLWCKHTNFEQAVRSPLIIASPKGFKANRTGSPTEFVDVFPTLCELAGLEIPPYLPGKSLVPLMEDSSASVRRDAMAQYTRTLKGAPVMGYSLRDERYRYTKWLQMDYQNGERTGELVATELYDYSEDPLETVNRAADPDYCEIVHRFEESFTGRDVAQER